MSLISLIRRPVNRVRSTIRDHQARAQIAAARAMGYRSRAFLRFVFRSMGEASAAMIHAYVPRNGFVDRLVIAGDTPIPTGAWWFDLFEPTAEERRRIEAALGVQLPSREEIRRVLVIGSYVSLYFPDVETQVVPG